MWGEEGEGGEKRWRRGGGRMKNEEGGGEGEEEEEGAGGGRGEEDQHWAPSSALCRQDSVLSGKRVSPNFHAQNQDMPQNHPLQGLRLCVCECMCTRACVCTCVHVWVRILTGSSHQTPT